MGGTCKVRPDGNTEHEHGAAQLVVRHVEDAQVDKLADLRGDGAADEVVADVQIVHLHLLALGARVVDVAPLRVEQGTQCRENKEAQHEDDRMRSGGLCARRKSC